MSKRRSNLALGGLWLRARLVLIRRTPRATFFTFVFPVILLVLLDGLGESTVTVQGRRIPFAQYFTPTIAIFALTAATYTFTIFGVATAREQGILKRIRGTPLPMSVFLGSWVAANVLVGIASVTLMFVVAVPAFGLHVEPRLAPAALVTLLLGALTFSALGFAVASFVRRAETAPIVANITLFPLLFVSGVFFPSSAQPAWLRQLADIFPLSHLVDAFSGCFSPYTAGSGFAGGDLAVLAVWGAAGAWVAVHRFRREATDATGEASARRFGLPQLRRLPASR